MPAHAAVELQSKPAIVDDRGFAVRIPRGMTVTAKPSGWLVEPTPPAGIAVTFLPERSVEALNLALQGKALPLQPLPKPGTHQTLTQVQTPAGPGWVSMIVAVRPDVGTVLFMCGQNQASFDAAQAMAETVAWSKPRQPEPAPSAGNDGPRTAALRQRITGMRVSYKYSASSVEVFDLCPDGTFTSTSSSRYGSTNINHGAGTSFTYKSLAENEDAGRWQLVEENGDPVLRTTGQKVSGSFTLARFLTPNAIATQEQLWRHKDKGQKSTAHLVVLGPASCT